MVKRVLRSSVGDGIAGSSQSEDRRIDSAAAAVVSVALHSELLRGLPQGNRLELNIGIAGTGGIQYQAVAAGRATQHTECSIGAVCGVKRRTEGQRQITDVVLRGGQRFALN